jgi:hypothetical protein
MLSYFVDFWMLQPMMLLSGNHALALANNIFAFSLSLWL